MKGTPTYIIYGVIAIIVLISAYYGYTYIDSIINPKGLQFEIIKLDPVEIKSTETATITINVRNFGNEKFDSIYVKTTTDDQEKKFLLISPEILRLPSLDLDNKNTGDHKITITPFNIPLEKMPFKIMVEVYANGEMQPKISHVFDLTVTKIST